VILPFKFNNNNGDDDDDDDDNNNNNNNNISNYTFNVSESIGLRGSVSVQFCFHVRDFYIDTE
jgi:hypothetical protein